MGSPVSVIISTFNSSRFILETLESVAGQSWGNLELIITDDCSVDDTIEICKKWLNEKKNRFTYTKVITHEKNSGISANANRGLAEATGEWIKFLGADDTLKPVCIEDNMSWVILNPDIKILFSQIDIYKDTFKPGNFIRRTPEVPYNHDGLLAPWRSADSQYRMLLTSDRIHFSPSLFIHRQTLLSIGGFDERFRMLEDYPLWLNLTRNGIKLHFFEGVTVNYRQHTDAINNTGNHLIVNPNYFRSENFRKLYTYPNLPSDIRLNERFNWYTLQIFRFGIFNRGNKLNHFLMILLTVYLNPFRYYLFFKKKLVKNMKYKEFYE